MKLYGILNGCVKLILLLVLLVAGLYGGYALWDNQQVSRTAELQREEQLQWKPEDRESPSFGELQQINPDVVGWISMEGTPIDFPIVQGRDNLTYLNRDLQGEFSLAGSIFLDCRNQKDFLDPYNLIYGHHMAQGNMFGGLDAYRDPEFLDTFGGGVLMTPQGEYTLRVYGVLLVKANHPVVFDPDAWNGNLDTLQAQILYQKETVHPERTLALSTCAGDFPDARLVVLAAMEGGSQ